MTGQCKMRKAVVLLLAVIMTVAYMPFAGEVWADKPPVDTDGTYSFQAYDDGGGTGSFWITGYSGSENEIILPVSYTSSKTGTTFSSEKWAIEVKQGAFDGVKSTLTKIAFPKGVDAILPGAFQGFTGLKEVAIDDSVQYIGQNAFSGCPNLMVYRINGTNVSSLSDSGIGQDDAGKIYPGVTVYTKAGSAVDTYIKQVNEDNKTKYGEDAAQITLVYEADPYAGNTVTPTTSNNTGGDGKTGGDNNTNGGTTGGDNNTTGGTTGGDNTGGNTGGNTGNSGNAAQPTTDRTKQMGEDGTAYGKGAAVEAVNKAVTKYAKETDPKGSCFYILQAKSIKVTKNSVKVQWKKVKGAKKYVVYGNACGAKNKMVKLTTLKKNSIVFKKVNKKKVKKGTYYKFIIVAVDKNNNVLSTSKMVHAATTGGKNGNDKAVTTKAKGNKVTLKAKKSFKLGAKSVPVNKKLKVKWHRKTGVSFESSNPKIASVTGKGVIKAKKKGKCEIYAYAQNGVCAKIKVTVK